MNKATIRTLFRRSGYVLLLSLNYCPVFFASAQEIPQKAIGSATGPIGDNKLIIGRYLAIDNVCAWPNLTVLRDGTILASIFNKPSHGLMEGDVECWASVDGKMWEKRSAASVHDKPQTNRMNVAAGTAKNNDMIVVASGWLLQPAQAPNPGRGSILSPWVSRSADGGKTWSVDTQSFPKAESGRTEYIPFGDIVPGEDGSLRVTAYSLTRDRKKDKVSMFRSADDGKTWQVMSVISDSHNETAPFHLGGGKWIAAARGSASPILDQFRSDDDGKTWRFDQHLAEKSQLPGHLVRLKDGRLLLSYGNRTAGQFGVCAKISADNGATWGKPICLISDLTSQDSGYPSSVQLPDGTICTAYYAAGVASHQRYHMGVVLWTAPGS